MRQGSNVGLAIVEIDILCGVGRNYLNISVPNTIASKQPRTILLAAAKMTMVTHSCHSVQVQYGYIYTYIYIYIYNV